MRRRRGGLISTITSILLGLVLIGIFLAVLAQFGGDVGALFKWVIEGLWSIIISIRDSVAGWETFQRAF